MLAASRTDRIKNEDIRGVLNVAQITPEKPSHMFWTCPEEEKIYGCSERGREQGQCDGKGSRGFEGVMETAAGLRLCRKTHHRRRRQYPREGVDHVECYPILTLNVEKRRLRTVSLSDWRNFCHPEQRCLQKKNRIKREIFITCLCLAYLLAN